MIPDSNVNNIVRHVIKSGPNVIYPKAFLFEKHSNKVFVTSIPNHGAGLGHQLVNLMVNGSLHVICW